MTAPIRLFVSSPSDVAAERMAVERVARRLEGLFDDVAIEVYRWEKDRYYSAHTGFQEQIAEIGGFDLVVGVLWSRLGSPLPPGFAARMPPPRDGEGYPSGTAFELLEAIRLRRARASAPPDIFVYRKTAPANTAAADDDVAQARLLADLQAVNRFMADFFANEQDGFKAAFKAVLTLDDFEATLQADLTAWLKANHRIGTPRQWRIEDRGAPFVGLNAFGADHREVFFGRRPEVERARERLEAGKGFLLIDGSSGTGKSSLARAGLLPRLSDLDPHLRIAITVPETDAPLLSLVQALFAPGALPDLAEGDYPTAAALTGHLLAGGDAAPILRALDRAALRRRAEERLEEPLEVRLLLLIDQLEALFAKRVGDTERSAYARLIEQLVASNRALVVATLRANAREEALAIPSLGRLINARQGQGLEPPGTDALGEIVRAPAAAASIAYERDAEGIGLDEVLLREIALDPAALPLLQFALERLYQSAANRLRSAGSRLGDAPHGEPVLTLTHADYRALGGLSGAIGHQAEAALSTLPDAPRERLPALVRALTEDGGGTLVLGRATLARAAPDAPTQALIAALVDARILVQGMATERDGPPEPVLRFSHERVLTAWDRARTAAQAAATYLRVRGDLVRSEARWRSEERRRDLLLSPGVLLAEAQKAFADFGEELDRHNPCLRIYLTASARAALLRQRLAIATSVVFLIISLAAGWLAVLAESRAREAEGLRLLAQGEMRTALQNQRNATAILALSRAETSPVEALKLVLAAWPSEEGEPFPTTSMTYDAIRVALANTSPHTLLLGHEGSVNSVAFSPDGSHIVSGGVDGTLRMWDASSGAALGEPLRGHEGSVNSVAFSPDGNRIVSGGRFGAIRFWDSTTGDPLVVPLKEKRGHQIWGVSFSSDGGKIISFGSAGGGLWDSTTGVLLGEPISGQEGGFAYAAFSPDGSRIVTVSRDSTVTFWDSRTSDPVGEPIKLPESLITSVAFSPDNGQAASAGIDGTVRLWSTAGGVSLSHTLRGHEGSVESVAFSADSSRIVSGGEDGTIRLWDLPTPKILGRLLLRPSGDPRFGREITNVAYLPDGSRIASVSKHSEILSMDVDSDGKVVTESNNYGALNIWDVASGELMVDQLQWHKGEIASSAFSHDGSSIVVGSQDGALRIGLASNDFVLGEPFRGHEGVVNGVAFALDGSRIVSHGEDGTLRLWDATSGAAIGEPIRGSGDWLGSLAFSPDGNRIVGVSRDRTLRFWDAISGAPLDQPLHRNRGQGFTCCFTISPDGTRIVSQGGGHETYLWVGANDVPFGEPLNLLGLFDQLPAFSRDGSRVLSRGMRGEVQFWDATTGEKLGDLLQTYDNNYGQDDYFTSLAFSPDGKHFIGGSADGTITLSRNMPPGNILQVACRYLPHINGRPDTSTEGLAQELGITGLTLPEDCDTYDPPLMPD